MIPLCVASKRKIRNSCSVAENALDCAEQARLLNAAVTRADLAVTDCLKLRVECRPLVQTPRLCAVFARGMTSKDASSLPLAELREGMAVDAAWTDGELQHCATFVMAVSCLTCSLVQDFTTVQWFAKSPARVRTRAVAIRIAVFASQALCWLSGQSTTRARSWRRANSPAQTLSRSVCMLCCVAAAVCCSACCGLLVCC